jgi:CheY-like chemotaxis protein
LEALEAENGRFALDLLEQEHVDLILMDMNMPVMEGIEATPRIRAAEATTISREPQIFAMRLPSGSACIRCSRVA